MQLVAYGAQDIYLTGNPQITFFKVVYRRHTNFSMETIEQTINGSQTASGNGTVTISRNGDLVHKVYVTCVADAEASGGNTIINNVELEIGGQRIDKQTTQWNQIWADLSTPDSKAAGYQCMTGGCVNAETYGVGQIQVPLNFWFCRNPGLALPLIALQYHEVKIKCVWGATVGTRLVLCDYIYLDTDERRRFAQVSHEYLIEQIQEQSADGSGSFKLNFNHPVKELIWTSNATNSYGTAQLKLNGHDRFSAQQEEYFQLRQPMDYHTAVPGQNIVLNNRPQLLATPIELAHDLNGDNVVAGAYAADGHDTTALTVNQVGMVAAANNKLGIFNGDVVAGTTPTNPLVRLGDLLQITFVDDSLMIASAGGTNGGVTTAIARVTEAVYTAVDEEYLTLDRVIFGDNPAAADSIRVDIIARAQDPVSRTGSLTTKLNVYSFALKPEEHQPSGTCNFSRIDNAELKIGTAGGMATTDIIYAVNYNVLRIMSGMGGLAYSN